MTRDDCRAALAAAEFPPDDALRAALAFAAELVPEVTALLARTASDEPLLLAEERLAARGLAVLAAARRTEAFPALATLLAQSDLMWSRVLGGSVETTLPPLFTALFDDDESRLDAIYARLDEEVTPGSLKSALFLALGWLVADGRGDPIRLTDALNWFGSTADIDDPGWAGWFPAARALGLDAQVELNHQRHLDAIAAEDDAEEAAAWRAMLERATAPDALDAGAPIDDPAHAFAPARAFAPAPAAPTAAGALSPAEEDWLDWQLLTLSIGQEAMPLEAVDGYFTALHICPNPASFAPNEAPVWAGASAAERFARPEIAAAMQTLLARHFAAVGTRLADGLPAKPVLELEDDWTGGALWANGFVTGMDRARNVWEPLIRRPAVRDILSTVLLLGDDDGSDDDADFDPDPTALDAGEEHSAFRRELLDMLPGAMQTLWRVVRETTVRPARNVGRNDPCPCGSGRKYKKCCGAPAPAPRARP